MAALRSAAAPPDGRGPVEVFILAGQSNMEGHGVIAADPARNGGRGSLEAAVRDPSAQELLRRLMRPDSTWVVRDDVWVSYLGGPAVCAPASASERTVSAPSSASGRWSATRWRPPCCWSSALGVERA